MKRLLFGASTLLSLSAMTQEPTPLLEALADPSIEGSRGRMMTATGEVLAHWVTTTGETPLAKGSWDLSAAPPDRARMAMVLPTKERRFLRVASVVATSNTSRAD